MYFYKPVLMFLVLLPFREFQIMNQSNSSTSATPGVSASTVTASAVAGICCLVGISGNLAVIVVVARKLKNRDSNFTLKLILNLAVADILSLCTLPVWVHSWLRGWQFGIEACRFFSYVIIGSLYCSVWTVTLMSVQRYLAVLYPRQWLKLRGVGEKLVLSGLWALAAILASPGIVLSDVVGEEKKCRWKYISSGQKAGTLLMETLWGFVIPFAILVSSYCCLHTKVNRSVFFSSQRLTTLVTSIVVTFFIFWSPVHVVNILGVTAALLEHKALDAICETSWGITQALTFINCCINPFLYAFAFRKRKQETEHSGLTQESKI
ncbi:leukotriene B4 receptor 1-like [Scleropages formosus]|nr:leukotriene B4 receptor 1-like [Scleropages formosus]